MNTVRTAAGPFVAPPLTHPMQASDVSVWYHDRQVLRGVTLDLPPRLVTALIGPSGCGKSTFLRCFNRTNELLPGVKTQGVIRLDGMDIHSPGVDVTELRRRVGMVFQNANPFPKSIYDNVAYGLRLRRRIRRSELDDAVEQSLRRASLWEEVRDQLDQSALRLSAGQQQRLCIARAIAVDPDVLLMDEPAGSLDPVATARIEDLILGLKGRYTIVVVTHNLQQATRISDQTAFFAMGELVEAGPTSRLFTHPVHKQTEDYLTGRFG
jgi:phosphate transport system ATP-binding protein